MASTSDPLAEVVSAAVIARAVGISARRVTQLRDEGKLPGAPGGKFLLGATIASYCEFQRGGSGANGDESGSELDLNQERAKLARAQTEGHELKNAVLRSELLPLDDMEEVVGAILESVRAKLLALPTKAAGLVLGLTGAGEARDILTRLVHEALSDLAETAAVVADIADRARRRIGRAGSDGTVDEEVAAASSADSQRVG